MDQFLEVIKTGIATDATPEARAAAVSACRTIAGALDATPGEPMPSSQPNTPPIAAMVNALRSMPADQLLDLAIARLRAALPVQPPAVATAFKVQLVPHAHVLGGKATP